MLRELLKFFRSDDAVTRMTDDFSRMLGLARDLTVRAGRIFFGDSDDPEELGRINAEDVEINKLERHIRKQVIAHLTLSTSRADVTYCLLLMSLVKDVERLGDYATNVAEIRDEGGGPLPDDEFSAELREIRTAVEATFAAASEVFESSDSDRALDLIKEGRKVTGRCDDLIGQVARSSHDAATTTTLVLGSRYYKRLEAHLLNVLSGVVMPLHKVDYYDERVLDPDD
jgi:phosphate transport system protein